MRILILGCKDYPAFATPWVHSGGMEVYVERMIRSLADRATFLVYGVGGVSDAAAEVRALGGRAGLRTQPVSLLRRSRRTFLRDRPDVALLNPQTPLSALVAFEANRRFGLPYVVTVHVFGADPAHAGGRLAARAYGAVEALVFSRAAAIVPTGNRLAETIARRHPRAASRIRTVTPAGTGPIETAPRATTRARLGVPADAPAVLFLGRLVEENGLFDLLEAVARARARLPAIELWIAGSGDLEEEARTRVSSRGLEGSVRWLGTLRGGEKLDVLAAADVLARFSRHEVFPEAYLEALSVGTPVVATPAGDTPDLAEDSGAVSLVPFDDPARQADVLLRLLSERGALQAMSERALDYSRRELWADRRERYWKILSAAASGKIDETGSRGPEGLSPRRAIR